MSDLLHPRVSVASCGNLSLAMVLIRRGATSEASKALQAQCGIALPSAGRLLAAPDMLLLWSGPDRYLALREDTGHGLVAALEGALGSLAHVLESSSSRSVFHVAGFGAQEALSRLLPIDLHPRVFVPGSVALTIAGHIAVQVWRQGEQPAFHLACASSLGASFRRQLMACCDEANRIR